MKPRIIKLVLAGCALGSAPAPAQDKPGHIAVEPLPTAVVKVWQNAGAWTGMMADGPLTLQFLADDAATPKAAVPAFRFGDAWRVGLLAKLPAPPVPFGLSFANMTDRGLKELAPMRRLRMLDVRNTLVTDAGLKELAPFQDLRSLKLGVRVTDKGLKELASLPRLKALYLLGRGITDAGLKELAGMRDLQRLSLRDASVTDGGMKELTALKHLRVLDLYHTGVTDAALKELATLKSLETLDLTKTQVSEAGLRELRTGLPSCRISLRRMKSGGPKP